MGLGWDSALKLGAIVFSIFDAISIIVFFNIARGYESFWLSLILIFSVLAVILVLVSWIASKKVEKELVNARAHDGL